jgi:AbrB family looped-hinge helix DNA binding protein
MQITSKGQVTIPQELRNRAGLLPRTRVEFDYIDGNVVIRRAQTGAKYGPRAQAAIDALENSGFRSEWTTDEIMAMTRDYPLPKKKRSKK